MMRLKHIRQNERSFLCLAPIAPYNAFNEVSWQTTTLRGQPSSVKPSQTSGNFINALVIEPTWMPTLICTLALDFPPFPGTHPSAAEAFVRMQRILC